MDYEAWRFWIDISQVALTAGIGVYVWLVNRTRVNAARIRKLEDDIDERLDGHDDRLARIESAIEHGPKREAAEGLVAKASRESKAGRGVTPERLREIIRDVYGVG